MAKEKHFQWSVSVCFCVEKRRIITANAAAIWPLHSFIMVTLLTNYHYCCLCVCVLSATVVLSVVFVAVVVAVAVAVAVGGSGQKMH